MGRPTLSEEMLSKKTWIHHEHKRKTHRTEDHGERKLDTPTTNIDKARYENIAASAQKITYPYVTRVVNFACTKMRYRILLLICISSPRIPTIIVRHWPRPAMVHQLVRTSISDTCFYHLSVSIVILSLGICKYMSLVVCMYTSLQVGNKWFSHSFSTRQTIYCGTLNLLQNLKLNFEEILLIF